MYSSALVTRKLRELLGRKSRWNLSRLLTLGLLALLLTAASGAVAAQLWAKRKPQWTPVKLPPASRYVPPPPIQNGKGPRAEALPMQLKAGGFVPREVTRPAGSYYFSIQNVSGAPEITLQLQREGEGKVREVRLTKENRAWRELVRLTPGNYRLTEANHPEWVCRISITAEEKQ
jgi:hypothetical protein